jgi:hypothetical protein
MSKTFGGAPKKYKLIYCIIVDSQYSVTSWATGNGMHVFSAVPVIYFSYGAYVGCRKYLLEQKIKPEPQGAVLFLLLQCAKKN